MSGSWVPAGVLAVLWVLRHPVAALQRVPGAVRRFATWTRRHARATLRIARWEVSKSAGTVNRFTVAVVVVGALLAAVAGPAVVSDGVDLDEGIYRVEIDDDSPYRDVVRRNSQFVAVDDADRADVSVVGNQVAYDPDDRKSRAAASEFRAAVQRYNDAVLREEVDAGGNESAAFPVDVTLVYQSRLNVELEGGADGSGANDGGDGTDDGASGGAGGDAGGGGDGDGGGAGSGDGSGDGGGGDGQVSAPDIGGQSTGGGIFGGNTQGSPGDISPPFPFASLVLAFVFVVPMNFVIQAYGSSIMEERLNRRGELLLVSPVTRFDIIAGKTLPYFVGLLAIEAAVTAFVHGGDVSLSNGPMSFLAVVPIVCVFLAFTFVGGMFARSFKELSFVTVSLSVFLTSYVFVPAIFTEITPIALISPLTVVVRDLEGLATTLPQYVFSTGPFYLSAGVLFALGAGVYREEDMFTQRSVPLKALDAIGSQLHSRKSVLKMSVLLLPFVLVAELLLVATLFAVPTGIALWLLLPGIAVVEEVAKSVAAYAGFAQSTYDRSLRSALGLGALSGLGFFVAEKGFLVVQVVGLQDVETGSQAFAQAQASSVDPLLAVGLLLAPLLLHVVTATISTVGASRNATTYLASLVIAVAVHVAYNVAAIGVVGGV